MALRSVEAHHRDTATLKLAAKIALTGGAENRRSFISKWKPYCDDPLDVYRSIRPGGELAGVEVMMKVPCRRCAKCLQYRQMQWRERALYEIAKSNRTWFVTLTFSPVHLAGILQEAGQYTRLSREKAVDRAAFGHVQRFFKRLRKDGYRFRYLAVYERGEETGRSHYHLFLHEYDRPIGKRVLEERWRSLVHARLVSSDDGAASYLTKYTTKSLDIAPRASLRYGKVPAPPAEKSDRIFPQEKENLDAQSLKVDALGTSLKIGDMKNGSPCGDLQVNKPSAARGPSPETAPDGATPDTCDVGENDTDTSKPVGSIRFVRCTRADHSRSLGNRGGCAPGLANPGECENTSRRARPSPEPERLEYDP